MIVISDGRISAQIDPMGATLDSAVSLTNSRRLIWRKDPAFWKSSAPVLFPFIGRYYEGKYITQGKVYPMTRHGFIRDRIFTPIVTDPSKVIMAYESSDSDYEIYPYRFSFITEYRLEDTAIAVRFTVSNRDKETMPFSIGYHPGFEIPEPFEECCFTFAESRMKRAEMSEDILITGEHSEDVGDIQLSHDLFDNDAIVLSGYGGAVAVRKDGKDIVRVISPDFPVTALWHTPGTKAPFVCIESWSGYPGSAGRIDDIDRRSDFLRLAPGEERSFAIRMEFPE